MVTSYFLDHYYKILFNEHHEMVKSWVVNVTKCVTNLKVHFEIFSGGS